MDATRFATDIDPEDIAERRRQSGRRPGDLSIDAHRVDLREGTAIRALIERTRPDVILHTAGSNRTPASLESIEPAAIHLADAARDRAIRLIHVSTDLIFDGEQAPYDESSEPKPLSPYGEAKAHAEREIRARLTDAVIVRTSLIWGVDPPDHQTTWLLDGVRSGEPVRLFTDELRCPIHVTDLAEALLELATIDFTGTIDIVGPEAIDRFTFGSKILAMMGIDHADNVMPSTIAESGLTRPRDLTLDISLAQRTLRTRLRSVDEIANEHS